MIFHQRKSLFRYSLTKTRNGIFTGGLSILQIIMLCFVCCSSALAEQKLPSSTEVELLARAEYLMVAKKGDDVLAITEPLIHQLKGSGRYNSSFGFNVRLVHARAIYDSSEEVEAVDILWDLRDESKKYQEWKVYAEICVELAKLQEISGQSEEALQHLYKAKAAIQKYGLDSLYGEFAIRSSSWHRFFGNVDSSYFFAQEAIRTGRALEIVNEEATGYLLSSFLLYGRDDLLLPDSIDRKRRAIKYLKKAAILYKKINDLSTYAGVQSNLASFLLKEKSYQEALIHADTAIKYSLELKAQSPGLLIYAFQNKAKILQKINQLDSAIVYFQKAHQAEVTNFKIGREEQLIEIDKKFNFEKKSNELEIERLKNRLLIGFIFLALIFTVILAFYYFRLRKANAIVNIQANELKKLDEVKSRFFTNVSHELRTPLTLILGPVNAVLKGGQLANKDFTLLATVRQNVKTLSNLVNSLLDLSKMEAGKMELEETTEVLFPLVRRIVGNFESHCQREGIQFQYIYKAQEKLQLELDKKKLEIILNNLLSNAIKFTRSGGKIIITVEDLANTVKFSVIDSGQGIHPDDLPHVFNRFYQAKKEKNNSQGGSGIGLAICQEYLMIMGGKIWAESTLGKGSSFFVQIPRKEILGVPENTMKDLLRETFKPDYSTINQVSTKDKIKILVVEDNYDLRNYIKLIISNDFEVLEASNGSKALQILEECSASNDTKQMPRLIISDIMMPEMDGFQLLEALKKAEKYAHLPVIMLTARVDMHAKLKALRIGVDDYMLKPFQEEELITRVQNLLNNFSKRTKVISSEEKMLEEKMLNSSQVNIQDQEWLEQIETIIKKEIANNKFSVPQMAQSLFISERHFRRRLKQLTGLSPSQYLQELRLNEARRLLELGTYRTVAEVSNAIGFQSRVSFTRSFVNRFGKRPSEYLY